MQKSAKKQTSESKLRASAKAMDPTGKIITGVNQSKDRLKYCKKKTIVNLITHRQIKWENRPSHNYAYQVELEDNSINNG